MATDSILESVEATDDMTVVFTLKQPNPTFLYGLVLPCFGIVSPAVLEETGARASPTARSGPR